MLKFKKLVNNDYLIKDLDDIAIREVVKQVTTNNCNNINFYIFKAFKFLNYKKDLLIVYWKKKMETFGKTLIAGLRQKSLNIKLKVLLNFKMKK